MPVCLLDLCLYCCLIDAFVSKWIANFISSSKICIIFAWRDADARPAFYLFSFFFAAAATLVIYFAHADTQAR